MVLDTLKNLWYNLPPLVVCLEKCDDSMFPGIEINEIWRNPRTIEFAKCAPSDKMKLKDKNINWLVYIIHSTSQRIIITYLHKNQTS